MTKIPAPASLLIVVITLATALVPRAQAGESSKPNKAATPNGIYEYVYPHNTDDLIENHYMVFETKNGKTTGTYFGTSDDFDDSREGYLPGFFKAPMTDLTIVGGLIKFKVKITKDSMMARSVAPNATEGPNKKWDQKPRSFERSYQGAMKFGTITLSSEGIEPRTFKPITLP